MIHLPVEYVYKYVMMTSATVCNLHLHHFVIVWFYHPNWLTAWLICFLQLPTYLQCEYEMQKKSIHSTLRTKKYCPPRWLKFNYSFHIICFRPNCLSKLMDISMKTILYKYVNCESIVKVFSDAFLSPHGLWFIHGN